MNFWCIKTVQSDTASLHDEMHWGDPMLNWRVTLTHGSHINFHSPPTLCFTFVQWIVIIFYIFGSIFNAAASWRCSLICILTWPWDEEPHCRHVDAQPQHTNIHKVAIFFYKKSSSSRLSLCLLTASHAASLQVQSSSSGSSEVIIGTTCEDGVSDLWPLSPPALTNSPHPGVSQRSLAGILDSVCVYQRRCCSAAAPSRAGLVQSDL